MLGSKADVGIGDLRIIECLKLPAAVVSKTGKIVACNPAFASLDNQLMRLARIRYWIQTGRLLISADPVYEEVVSGIEDGDEMGAFVILRPRGDRSGNETRIQAGTGKENTAWAARYTFNDIIGQSPALVEARKVARQAAEGGSVVLLSGESGTGKELFAHAIHAASPRRHAPFVPVDCSAIPRELLEAELFGYAPGAFTGAAREGKIGKFELAQGGTIFLDEIGEMPLETQARLLRVLQERQVTRVGGITTVPVTFGLVTATNRNLEYLAVQGRFRRDLLYRLDVIRIEVPPLRERPEDVPLLVAHYWGQKSWELGRGTTLSTDAVRLLEAYDWPGNVRELINLVERLLVSVAKPMIEPDDLPAQFQLEASVRNRCFPSFDLPKILAEAERRTLERALRQTHGNRNGAAQLIGISRATFYRKLVIHGLTYYHHV